MAEFTKESISKIKSMGMGPSLGLTAGSIKDIGKRVSSMARGNTFCPTDSPKLVNGLMARRSDG